MCLTEEDLCLLRERRNITDPRNIAAIGARWRNERGAPAADACLLQLGFVHGYRDATEVLQDRFLSRQSDSEPALPTGTSIRVLFGALSVAPAPGGVEVPGSWPDHLEASLGDSQGGGCRVSAGYTSGWLSGLLEADVLAVENTCSASGEPNCEFVAREADTWWALQDERAHASLAMLPFAQLRDWVSREFVPEPASADAPYPEEAQEAEAPVVQVWGPVMIVPFTGGQDAAGLVDLIGTDPEAHEVSVVIVDLQGQPVDETYGAIALEHLLEAIERWGAEAMLAGVSPLAERAVASLERATHVIQKDFPQAIALAFQIAEAQKSTA